MGINVFHSCWQPVISGVPQGLILFSTVYTTFPNDLDGGIESALIKFSDDTELDDEEDT